MPPEPLPWDRKELLFNNRKYGWRERDSSYPYIGSRTHHFSPRWGFPSSDFRRPPGHAKQGGWHMYPEDHGYSTPRSGDRFMDDDGFRQSGMRGDGRYGRFYRDNRPSFGHKDWRCRSWEPNHHHNGPANGVGRTHFVNETRSVGDSPMHASHPHSDTCDQLHLKDDQVEKTSDANGSGMSQKADKENVVGSVDWNPHKWSHSRSLNSRGSGFSHSSSSKSIGGESSDVKCDLPPKNATPVQSFSGDAVPCVPFVAPPEEASSRKKARLGWGEGLAKYEKKKVDEPEDNVNKASNAMSVNIAEPSNSLASNLADKSPMVMGFSDCSSPATPSSFACSSSPGLDDKAYGKTIDVDGDASNFSVSSMPVPECQPEGSLFSLEKLEMSSIANLGSMLNELLQADDQCSLDNGFMGTSAWNKLMLWKNDISKALELTETEIDSLENELTSLKFDKRFHCPASSKSGPDDPIVAFNVFPRPQPLEVVSSGDVMMEDKLPCEDVIGNRADSKDEDIDSPGTATSKFADPPVQNSLSLEVCKNSSCREINFLNFTTSSKENVDINRDTGDVTSCQIHDRDLRQDANNIIPGIGDPCVCDKKEDNICEKILASNKEFAAQAIEVLQKLLPSCDYSADTSKLSFSLADPIVKDKFLKRKRFLRFKERVISLKFRTFHHLWKEDLRLLSLRNHRTKPQKKLDLFSRTLQLGTHKHRPFRSRFASSAGSFSLVPTTEIINSASKLLSDPQVKVYRSSLKMPSMILDDKEKMLRFVSTNGLVEDPCAVEKERSLVNPWTTEEKDIFIDKLAIHGKDFRKIASFIDHKTTADCVEFYYKNHKSECFEKIKKFEVKKQGKPLSSSTYLVTSEKKWSREMNAASLDILGAASVMAAQTDQVLETSRRMLGKSSSKDSGLNGTIEASCCFYCAEDERETVAADVLAGICGSLSSEAMSSCITSSIDPGEGNQDRKHQRVGSSIRRPLTPELSQNVDGSCSDESCGEMDPTDWTDDEKFMFVQAFSSHGKDFLMISRCVGTKSRDQCKVFFSKARKCLGLDTLDRGPRNARMDASNDTNGGGSETEDAGIVETGSIVCSDKSGSRIDEDVLNVNRNVSKPECLLKSSMLEENCGPWQLDHKDTDMELDDTLPHAEMVDVSDPIDRIRVDDLDMDSAIAVNTRRSVEDDKLKMDISTESVAEVDPHVSGAVMDMGSGSAPVGLLSSGGVCPKPLMNRENAHKIQSGEPPCSLKGFPLDLSIKADLHDVVTHSIGAESIIDSSFHGSFFQKCTRTITPQHSALERSLLKQSEGDLSCHKTEKPSCKNGDVKLFGKILNKPSSDITNSEEKAKHHPSWGKFDLKLAAKQDSKGNSTCFADDHNNFIGLENVPIRSYGFWDGTKIQTGFPHLPDSALLLAKYPAAFANYAIPSPKSEQPLMQAAGVNGNECDMNGACVFSPREFNGSNGSVFRNQEGGLQPFRLDRKQRSSDVTFPEAVQRNGFESVAGLPQLGKGLAKSNVVQGADILGVGSSCTWISDPVAALNLRYASQPFGGSGSGHPVNGIIREESWQSQGGDVGR